MDDIEQTVLWLRDRELLRDVPQRYARGVDSRDFALVRGCFTDGCHVSGARTSAPIDEYMTDLEPGVRFYEATLHFMGNQYVEVEPGADTASVETYAVAYHVPAEGDDLVMGVRYCDDLVRSGAGWLISGRVVHTQWRHGELPDT